MAEEGFEDMSMEEMINEAFSNNEQKIVENDMFDQMIDDFNSLINLDMKDDSTIEKVNNAFELIKDDMVNLPEYMNQELHSLKEVMTDFSDLLGITNQISVNDFEQARQVLAEDLDNIRIEHQNSRFFGSDDFDDENILELDEELDEIINDEVTDIMDKTSSLITADINDDLSSNQILADVDVLKESMNDLPLVVQEKQKEFSRVMDDFVNLLHTKEYISPSIYQQTTQVLSDDLNNLRKNNNKKFFEDYQDDEQDNEQDGEFEFDDELNEIMNDELTEKMDNVVKFLNFGIKDKSTNVMRGVIDSIMDDIEMMPKSMKAEHDEFENVMHDITNLLDHREQASPAEFELAMNVVKDNLLRIRKEHLNKRFFQSPNSHSQSFTSSSTHSQSPKFSSSSPPRPQFESAGPPAPVGPIHIIPINTVPKVGFLTF